jgi:hypothetical protein
LLGGQRVAAAIGLVFEEAAGRLCVAPFTDITLGDAGLLGQLAGRQLARAGQGPVQPELVAHHDKRRVERRADLVDGAEYKGHQAFLIQRSFGVQC